jgi:hypothetical protein
VLKKPGAHGRQFAPITSRPAVVSVDILLIDKSTPLATVPAVG